MPATRPRTRPRMPATPQSQERRRPGMPSSEAPRELLTRLPGKLAKAPRKLKTRRLPSKDTPITPIDPPVRRSSYEHSEAPTSIGAFFAEDQGSPSGSPYG